jgi:DegV family protein with EDD domain
MTVKVVTDSTCDIPPQLMQDLDITVVPIYVVFGDKSYRDKLDISADEFYDKLIHGPVHPTTSIPTPKDFADVFNRLAEKTDEIIAILITSRESGTFNAAVMAKELVTNKKCRIEVVDSLSMSMALGLLVIEAGRQAKAGASLDKVAEAVRQAVPKVHLLFLVDTLKYVVRGGRLGKAYGILGSALRIKPLLTLKEGDLSLVGIARTKAKAVERLYEFVKGFSRVKEIAVSYTTDHEEAQAFADRLKAAFPDVPLNLTRVGSSLGVHAGPGGMGVAVREG